MPRIAFPLTLLLTAILAACASSGGPSSSPSSRNVITAEELVPGRFSSALEAVERLRPGWLRRLGGVYVEGHAVTPDRLELEPVGAIAEIRLISCEQAMMRYPVSCVSNRYLEITRKH